MSLIKFANKQLEAAYHAETNVSDKVNLAFSGIYQHIPKISKYLIATKAAAKFSGTLSHRLYELVRIRMAFHTQCRTCMTIRYEDGINDGLDQAAICALERPQQAENLTPQERMAIEYCDKFALDWLSVDAKYFDKMRELFTEAEIVQLGMICALHLGTGRLTAQHAVTEELPETMQGPSGDHRYKPWEVDFDSLVMESLPKDTLEDVSTPVAPKLAVRVAKG
jgi:alkylhydroperoxidase family enzyme